MQNEIDILREVGSIASGHGSIALSEILGRRIGLSVPTIDIVALSVIPEKMKMKSIGIAVKSKCLTGLKGEVAFLLDEKNAFKLIELSYKIRAEDKKLSIITETGMSLIKEVGNMVIGAYVSAISLMFKKIILPYVPTLISGSIEEIMNIIVSGCKNGDYVVIAEALFEVPQEKGMGGSFYLILNPEAAAEIQRDCLKILTELGKK